MVDSGVLQQEIDKKGLSKGRVELSLRELMIGPKTQDPGPRRYDS